MDLPQALSRYDAHQTHTLGLAGGTRKTSRREVRRFVDWTAGEGLADTRDITADLVERYAHHHLVTERATAARLGVRLLAESTANLYKSHLRGFFRWLAEEGELGADQAPQRKLVTQRNPRPARTKTFTDREKVPHYAAKARQWHPRDEAWVHFQFFMGRRAAELRAMRVGDLDLTPRPEYPFGLFVYDNTKGRKYRVPVQILPEFAPIARRWLEEYAELLGRRPSPEDYLIPALDTGRGRSLAGVRQALVLVPGRPVSKSGTERLLNRIGITSHSLRRGAARYLTRRYDIRVAQLVLGHSKQETTEIYQDLDADMVDFGAKLAAEARGEAPPQMPLDAEPVAPRSPETPSRVVDLGSWAARRSERRSSGF